MELKVYENTDYPDKKSYRPTPETQENSGSPWVKKNQLQSCTGKERSDDGNCTSDFSYDSSRGVGIMDRIPIRLPKGAKKRRKIVGRGTGSGSGSTAGRGTKGQNSRSGGGVRVGFEGGQMPLYRQLARRGFSNYPFKKKYSVINVSDLNCFDDDAEINKSILLKKGLIKRSVLPVKILGNGELVKKLSVDVDKVSASARDKIVKAGGQVIDADQPSENNNEG